MADSEKQAYIAEYTNAPTEPSQHADLLNELLSINDAPPKVLEGGRGAADAHVPSHDKKGKKKARAVSDDGEWRVLLVRLAPVFIVSLLSLVIYRRRRRFGFVELEWIERIELEQLIKLRRLEQQLK